jgi:hypothetical protein
MTPMTPERFKEIEAHHQHDEKHSRGMHRGECNCIDCLRHYHRAELIEALRPYMEPVSDAEVAEIQSEIHGGRYWGGTVGDNANNAINTLLRAYRQQRAEIERLQNLPATSHPHYPHEEIAEVYDERDELYAEVKRLREALKEAGGE